MKKIIYQLLISVSIALLLIVAMALPTFAEEDVPRWAENAVKTVENGIVNYVFADGTIAAEITDDGIVWLKCTSGGSDAWYGIQPNGDTFAPGSKFWVKWITKEDNPEEWQRYYDQIDSRSRRSLGRDTVILTFGVENPDGCEYRSLSNDAHLYVQLDSDWDAEDVRAMFAGTATDEPISIEYTNLMQSRGESPESGKFAVLELHHFGEPLVLADKLNTGSIITEPSFYTPVIVAVIAITAVIVLYVQRKKKATGENETDDR